MSVRDPLAYFITFRTYGTWLPGDDRGSTDRLHKGWAEPHLVPDPYRRSVAYSRLRIAPVTLSRDQRSSVERAIGELCQFRRWHLYALNVRTEHVHLVVSVGLRSERALTMLKAYATRRLRVARRVSPSPDAGAGAGDPIVGRVTGQFRERQAAEYAPPSPARRIGGTPERRRL